MSLLSELTKPIADKIRSFLGNEGLISPSQFESKIEDVYNAGKLENLKRFQDYGNRNFYAYAFAQTAYPFKVLELPYPILATAIQGQGFATPGANSIFRQNSVIEEILCDIIITATSSSNAGYVFQSCGNLKTIQNIVVNSTQTFSNWFFQNKSLEYIRWGNDDIGHSEIGQNLDMSACVKLNGASIYDTIIHLYSGASQKTLTLSQTAVNNATFPNNMTWDDVKALKPSGFTISLI